MGNHKKDRLLLERGLRVFKKALVGSTKRKQVTAIRSRIGYYRQKISYVSVIGPWL